MIVLNQSYTSKTTKLQARIRSNMIKERRSCRVRLDETRNLISDIRLRSNKEDKELQIKALWAVIHSYNTRIRCIDNYLRRIKFIVDSNL